MRNKIISVILASVMIMGTFSLPAAGMMLSAISAERTAGSGEEFTAAEEGQFADGQEESTQEEALFETFPESGFNPEEEILPDPAGEIPVEESTLTEEALFTEEENILSEELQEAGTTLAEEDPGDELLSGAAEDELLQEITDDWGGYAFAGYLEPDVPNYVWEGKGEPSSIGHEIIFSGENVPESYTVNTAEDPYEEDVFFSSLPDEDLLTAASSEDGDLPLLGAPPVTTDGKNYFTDTRSSIKYHTFTGMSETIESSYADGLHTAADGRVRAYRNGRYFRNGAFALDNKAYYADENGWLTKGWLKTCGSDKADPSGIADCTDFAYRFYDRNTCVLAEGYRNVDGLWHYFESGGRLVRNKPVTIEGNYYYSDMYGICERVKLRFGNVVTSENDSNNDMYLAKNSVTAVDITTFTGQQGKYSFRPKWYKGITSMELFGFVPEETNDAFYCTLMDGSLKGRIGCIYKNVGRYKGREIDLRLTVTDYDMFSLNGDNETGYFYVLKDQIGINACNTRSITADMEFLDHETQQAVPLEGYMTFADIDISQCLTILSEVDEVFVDQNCVLYKDPSCLSFAAPFEGIRNGTRINDPDKENWVQITYTGSHVKIRFGAAYELYEFYNSGTDITGEGRLIFNKTYTGDPSDYSIFRENGNLYRSWQGIYPGRLGRVSIPPISKTVSDMDEKDVTDNRLSEDERSYDYTLHHTVPAESEEFYYTAYTVTDDFEEGLSVLESGISVTDDSNADVTGLFDVKVEGRKVEFSAGAGVLDQESFYDRVYHFHVPVKIDDIEALPRMDGDDYLIYNTCTAGFERPAGAESSTSNRTSTRVKEPFGFGSITITKKIEADEIVWAHGNPTFLFSAEGTDTRDNRHRYEDFICFREENLSVDSEGMAVLSVTIDHVPLGSYKICEMDVSDYYLTGAEAESPNMTVTLLSEPGPGKDPAEVMYGTCSLTREMPDAGISFTDKKSSWQGYRHRDVVENTIPIEFR